MLLKEYISSVLNEIRGELDIDRKVIDVLCEVVGLISYKAYIENLDDYDESFSSRLKQNPNLYDLSRCIEEVLEDKKKKLFNLSSFKVYSFKDTNDEVDFVKHKINNNNFSKEVSSIANRPEFSFLLFGSEEIDIGDGLKSNIGKYLIINSLFDEGSFNKEKDYLGTYRTLYKSKKDIIGLIHIAINTNMTGFKTFKTVLNDFDEAYKTEISYEKIKSYIMNSFTSKKYNRILFMVKWVINHELLHWYQVIKSYKIARASKKEIKKLSNVYSTFDDFIAGTPEVYARSKDRKDKDKQKLYWSEYIKPYELKPSEFYPLLANEWLDLSSYAEFILNKSKDFKVIETNKNIKVVQEKNIVLNTFKEYINLKSWWLSKLKKEHSTEKSKKYYNKAVGELYKKYIDFIEEYKKRMISLYEKNKDKILKDIQSFEREGIEISITNDYLVNIDKQFDFADYVITNYNDIKKTVEFFESEEIDSNDKVDEFLYHVVEKLSKMLNTKDRSKAIDILKSISNDSDYEETEFQDIANNILDRYIID